ncbi:AMP-dependent synthetase/ligase [Moheibacter sp.]|uniref:AMP-dependent synthetase/ligase n=1 Tax=Moheibacter sp. TaxID=1965316 RepID=UPI003C71F597
MKITRLFDILEHQLRTSPRTDSIAMKKNGKWQTISTQEYVNKANAISRGFLKLGVKHGDKIAIASTTNRTEWNLLDIGLQQIGCIGVPVYPTISPKDYAYIFNDSEVKFAFVSDAELYEKIISIKEQVPSLIGVYTFDHVEGAPNLNEILDLGSDAENQHEVEAVKEHVKPEDLVTIIYTSGTTGKPKGVMLSHNNILSNVLASNPRVPKFPSEKPKALSFLPLCHIFERMLIYLYTYNSIGIYYAENMETIGDNLKEVKPDVMTVVPRLVEKVYAKIYDKGASAGGIKTKIFMWALGLVENYEPFGDQSLGWKIKHKIADAIVFKKWREGVGGNMTCMVSGSAALSPRLNRMFWGAGIPILEGYGLTETSPVCTVNSMSKDGFGIGMVGKPIDGVEVKIAQDGEILIKGPNVMMGYYNNPEMTKEVMTEDGYFKTGDIGELHNGNLKITDRKKEIFKTSGGKYIAPQNIENDFKQSRFIEQIMVIGEGEKMPSALIQPSFENVIAWAKEENISLSGSREEMVKDQNLIDLIQREIDSYNKSLGHWEQIKTFRLTPDEWSIEGGQLTPTLKLKRRVIMDKYKDLYKELYGRYAGE